MPKILERLVNQLKSKGYDEQQAYAIGTNALQKSGNLKKNSTKPTKKGLKRGRMSPAQRKKSRKETYRKGKLIRDAK